MKIRENDPNDIKTQFFTAFGARVIFIRNDYPTWNMFQKGLHPNQTWISLTPVVDSAQLCFNPNCFKLASLTFCSRTCGV